MNSNLRIFVLLLLAGLVAEFLPGAPGMAQQPAPYRLTLQDAIQKALQANLNLPARGFKRRRVPACAACQQRCFRA